MCELLLNPMPASFFRLGSFKTGGITVCAWAFTIQLDFQQPHSSFHDEPHIVCHLVFILTPEDLQHLQVQVLQILGWLPHHVGLLGTVLVRLGT